MKIQLLLSFLSIAALSVDIAAMEGSRVMTRAAQNASQKRTTTQRATEESDEETVVETIDSSKRQKAQNGSATRTLPVTPAPVGKLHKHQL